MGMQNDHHAYNLARLERICDSKKISKSITVTITETDLEFLNICKQVVPKMLKDQEFMAGIINQMRSKIQNLEYRNQTETSNEIRI